MKKINKILAIIPFTTVCISLIYLILVYFKCKSFEYFKADESYSKDIIQIPQSIVFFSLIVTFYCSIGFIILNLIAFYIKKIRLSLIYYILFISSWIFIILFFYVGDKLHLSYVNCFF